MKELSPDMSEVCKLGGGGMWPILAQVPTNTCYLLKICFMEVIK